MNGMLSEDSMPVEDFEEGLYVIVKISISGPPIAPIKGQLHLEIGRGWFVCNNARQGQECPEKLGYRCSWKICDDTGARYGAPALGVYSVTLDPDKAKPKGTAIWGEVPSGK